MAVRGPLSEKFHKLRTRQDVYALPKPEQATLFSLGYRSALSDFIYAHVLVSYGLHFQERRLFEFVGEYLKTIITLDPKFRAPYRYADTLLTLQPKSPPLEHYYEAREILERGLREFPYDAELFSTAGQFMAYLAPSRIKDIKEKRRWQEAGARHLAKACELIGNSENLPYHCITAAGILTQTGGREAAISFLGRVLAVTEDPYIREMALGYLKEKIGPEERARAEKKLSSFREAWRKDLRFVSKDTLLILGPRFDSVACAGEHAKGSECSTSWRAWRERQNERSTGGQ